MQGEMMGEGKRPDVYRDFNNYPPAFKLLMDFAKERGIIGDGVGKGLKKESEREGKITGELGESLVEILEKVELKVFYDHGNHQDKHVCEPRLYFGDHFLGSADIVVLSADNRVKAICEIEEKGAVPKKIFGDLVGVLLADKIRIEKNNEKFLTIDDHYYVNNHLFFILGILETTENVNELKNRAKIIRDRIQNIIEPKTIEIKEPICMRRTNDNKRFKEEIVEIIKNCLKMSE